MIWLELNWFVYDPSWMLHLSEFVWTLRSSVLVVFNNFLLIDATALELLNFIASKENPKIGKHLSNSSLKRQIFRGTIVNQTWHSFLSFFTCNNFYTHTSGVPLLVKVRKFWILEIFLRRKRMVVLAYVVII